MNVAPRRLTSSPLDQSRAGVSGSRALLRVESRRRAPPRQTASRGRSAGSWARFPPRWEGTSPSRGGPPVWASHVWEGHIPGTPVAAMFEKGGCLAAGLCSPVSGSSHPAGATFSSGSPSPALDRPSSALWGHLTVQDSKTQMVGREWRLLLRILRQLLTLLPELFPLSINIIINC